MMGPEAPNDIPRCISEGSIGFIIDYDRLPKILVNILPGVLSSLEFVDKLANCQEIFFQNLKSIRFLELLDMLKSFQFATDGAQFTL